MSENYCPHCMRSAMGARCPSCGGDMSWRGQKGIDLPVGTVLNGGNGLRTYQVGAARGKGGFGITYIAREINSGRRVALKEYFPTRCVFRAGNEVDVQTMSGQEEVFRTGMNNFLEEGKMLLSQDDLACVVHVIDYFQANGTAYLAMEYLDGVALHTQMVQMGGRIPVSELMPRLALLMRDIGQLHRRGVIHRDISPDNIMWMPNGTLKLLDFGSARSMENGKSMTVLMKHGFSPIEQYRSKGQGPYTDIYALAATIYYCVTGVIPPAAVERLDEDGLQPPTALGAPLTVEQETALLWALSIQPNARPRSMEEFAARLYSGGPAQQATIQTEAQYSGPYGGQYNSQIGGQYSSQSGGQFNSQSGGQFNSQSGGQYNGQPSGQYNSQSGGQYNGQSGGQFNSQSGSQYNSQTGGQYNSQSGGQFNSQSGGQIGGGGGKNKMPILIGGVATAVLILAAVVIIMLNRGGSTADDPTQTVTVTSPPPTDTVAPDTPAPDTRTGVTDNGYLYEIIDRNNAVLTGYEGNSSVGVLPDNVDGIPITAIADNAFAGMPVDASVLLPIQLETIGAGAFRGCGDLQCVTAYSDVTVGATSFSGCNELWLVFSYDKHISGWNLPDGVHLFYTGMETGIGPVESLGMSDDGTAAYGLTEDDTKVLLDVHPGTASVYVHDNCEWICPWALDNLSDGAQINLGTETLYPYEAFSYSYSWYAPDGALSDMWLLSCVAAYEINAARPGGATQAEPDVDLMYASITRAEEYGELHELTTRPDGSSWDTALGDISFSWATGAAGYNYEKYDEMWNGAADYMAELYAPAISDGSSYAGQYYSRVGMGTVKQSDGQYAWWGFVSIP